MKQSVIEEFVKIHGENAEVGEVLAQHEADFAEYRQQFDAFSSEQLKLTRELKQSFDEIVTTLADGDLQASYFFQGKRKVAVFCREMYMFGSKKLDL
jgi:hypothetical protein